MHFLTCSERSSFTMVRSWNIARTTMVDEPDGDSSAVNMPSVVVIETLSTAWREQEE